MAEVTEKIKISVELWRPTLAEAGDEALRLARLFATFKAAEYDKLTQPIRDGFAYNFQQEGTPGQPWKELAELTVEERERMYYTGTDIFGQRIRLVPGFTGEHPILQRTGDYKQSWIEFGPRHAINVASSGAEGLNIEIEEGSKHPMAELLSLGGPNAAGAIVPARPAHIIDEMFTKRIGDFLGDTAHKHSLRVK